MFPPIIKDYKQQLSCLIGCLIIICANVYVYRWRYTDMPRICVVLKCEYRSDIQWFISIDVRNFTKVLAGLKSFQMRGLNAIASKERTASQSIKTYARGKQRPVQQHGESYSPFLYIALMLLNSKRQRKKNLYPFLFRRSRVNWCECKGLTLNESYMNFHLFCQPYEWLRLWWFVSMW